jgi:hypothetical protein
VTDELSNTNLKIIAKTCLVFNRLVSLKYRATEFVQCLRKNKISYIIKD